MNYNSIELSSEHKQCIISLINKIVAKSPHLTDLRSDCIVFMRLVSVISLIETTLCSKYQIVLKRNSTHNQSIQLIKSWLQLYYDHHFITSLCQNSGQPVCGSTEKTGQSDVVDSSDPNVEPNTTNTTEDNKDISVGDNDNNVEYLTEDIDRDIPLIALLILIIAHKLRQSLPRINAYFLPEWQTLSLFESVLKETINFDKILDLVQNELCVKRKQLEVTRSKVLSLQSTINSRNCEQNRPKKSKLDYRSNLFAEYEDMDTNEEKDLIGFDDNEEDLSEYSDGSAIFVDRLSDDDYEPRKGSQQKISSNKSSLKKSVKRGPIGRKSGRGRGRPPRDSLNTIRITPQPKSGHRSRGRPPKAKPIVSEPEPEVEADCEEPFECDICGKRFAKEYRLTRHSFTHLGRKQFVCDFSDCNESFDLKWKLAEHRLEHNGQNGAQDEEEVNSNSHYFECEWADCGLGFTSKRELTVHEHEMHANRSISKYSCDWPNCSEVFENKIEWRKHVRTHGKITPTMAFKYRT